ncbi:MAG: APC family permease [Eubacteriaceae bacterium]|nr:APC family permease [Eubacteriaceae bacterium]
MENKLQKKYGLFTAICMVIGIVIGSGIFFKAVKVFSYTGGNMGRSLLVVGIVGAIMIICSMVFATLGSKYEKVNGVVDYAEVALGPVYGYYVGWFMTIIYYPVLCSTLAWVAAQYACTLFGFPTFGDIHMALAALFLMVGFGVSGLSPKLAGKLQVSTTVIKLIPLGLMAVVGTVAGLFNGLTLEAFTTTVSEVTSGGGGVFEGVTAFAFAYEGWIIATSINAELKDAKKNLPKALILGALVCVGLYMLYFVGLSGALSTADILAAGDTLPKAAFSALFGNVAGTLVYVFIVISCLGTMNGLIMGCCRGMYSLSVRNMGPEPDKYGEVSKKSDMAANSSLIGMVLSGLWLFYWQFCFWDGLVMKTTNVPIWFNWEPDEIVIIALYAFYIPMFISVMVKEKDLSFVKRFLLPALAIASCFFMIYCTIVSYGMQCLYFLIFLALVMLLGASLRIPPEPKTPIVHKKK